jgi:hypothetical protein
MLVFRLSRADPDTDQGAPARANNLGLDEHTDLEYEALAPGLLTPERETLRGEAASPLPCYAVLVRRRAQSLYRPVGTFGARGTSLVCPLRPRAVVYAGKRRSLFLIT